MVHALRAQALWIRREAEKGVDLAVEEQVDRLGVRARHPVDVLGGIEPDQRRHRRNEDMGAGPQSRDSDRPALEVRDAAYAILGE